MRKVTRRAVSLLVIALAAISWDAGFAMPQHPPKPSGTLSGIVIGPDDKPVAHATISYQSASGTSAHAAHADARGRFSIPKLRADNYNVRASSNGVFSEWENNVLVRQGGNTSIVLRLIYAREMPKSYPPK